MPSPAPGAQRPGREERPDAVGHRGRRVRRDPDVLSTCLRALPRGGGHAREGNGPLNSPLGGRRGPCARLTRSSWTLAPRPFASRSNFWPRVVDWTWGADRRSLASPRTRSRRLGSRRASARCWTWWRPDRRTARSPPSCSSLRRPPAPTCRASWPSWRSTGEPRRRPSPTASASPPAGRTIADVDG